MHRGYRPPCGEAGIGGGVGNHRDPSTADGTTEHALPKGVVAPADTDAAELLAGSRVGNQRYRFLQVLLGPSDPGDEVTRRFDGDSAEVVEERVLVGGADDSAVAPREKIEGAIRSTKLRFDRGGSHRPGRLRADHRSPLQAKRGTA